MIEENQIQKEHIHFGHLGLILSVAVLLVGVSWMKNPDLFDVFKSESSGSLISANLPRYYAYEPPAQVSEAQVAGASTEGQGPMIINEDGTLSQAVENGDVLGALVGNEVLDLESVKIKVLPDSSEAINNYAAKSAEIENAIVGDSEFENALNSGNQALIDRESDKLRGVGEALVNLPAPESMTKLHKLKILQYDAAVNILQNFTQADSNPELVGQYLSRFLKAQQDLDAENNLVQQKYNLTTIGTVN